MNNLIRSITKQPRFPGAAKTRGPERRARRQALCKLIAALVFLSVLFAQNARADGIAVIVNGSGPLTAIPQDEIREIYLGNVRFVNGVEISFIHYRESPVKDAFLSSVIGMSSREYRLYWTKKVFQEGGSFPVSKDNFQSIISFVRKTPGAIAYVPISELTETSGVRVITKIENR